MFDVVSDAAERSRDLSKDPAHADTLAAIHKRLVELSATHEPQAGLAGDALDHDEQLKCAQFATTKCFEPYAPAVAWPHDGARKDESCEQEACAIYGRASSRPTTWPAAAGPSRAQPLKTFLPCDSN